MSEEHDKIKVSIDYGDGRAEFFEKTVGVSSESVVRNFDTSIFEMYFDDRWICEWKDKINKQ